MPSARVNELLIRNGILPPISDLMHYGVKGMKWGDAKTVEEIQAELAGVYEAAAKPPNGPIEEIADAETRRRFPNAGAVRKQGVRDFYTTLEATKGKPRKEREAAMRKVNDKYNRLLDFEHKQATQKRQQQRNIPV